MVWNCGVRAINYEDLYVKVAAIYDICHMSSSIAIYVLVHLLSQNSLSKSQARKFAGSLYPSIFQAISEHIRIFAHFRVAGILHIYICICVYRYVCSMCICIFAYIYIYVYMYIMYIYICIYMYIYVYICIYVYYVYIYVYIYMYVCMYVYIYI